MWHPNRKSGAIVLAVALSAAAIWLFWTPRDREAETRLIGDWMEEPAGAQAVVHTFGENRKYSVNGQVNASWRIWDGQLYLRVSPNIRDLADRLISGRKTPAPLVVNFLHANRVEIGIPGSERHAMLVRKSAE